MERVAASQEGNRRGAREQAMSSHMTRGRANQGWHSPGFLASHPAFPTSPGLLSSSCSPARPQQPPTKPRRSPARPPASRSALMGSKAKSFDGLTALLGRTGEGRYRLAKGVEEEEQ